MNWRLATIKRPLCWALLAPRGPALKSPRVRKSVGEKQPRELWGLQENRVCPNIKEPDIGHWTVCPEINIFVRHLTILGVTICMSQKNKTMKHAEIQSFS